MGLGRPVPRHPPGGRLRHRRPLARDLPEVVGGDPRGLRPLPWQGLSHIKTMVVAPYVEHHIHEGVPQTVTQHLAAIRMLFDWLMVSQVLSLNPASSVRGPRYSIMKGKAPMLTAAEARRLLDSIDMGHVVGLRDWALIGPMVYSFARVSAVVKMRIGDYYPNGKRY